MVNPLEADADDLAFTRSLLIRRNWHLVGSFPIWPSQTPTSSASFRFRVIRNL